MGNPTAPDGGIVVNGRYRLVEVTGRTEVSRVWRAENLQEGREVAIKERLPLGGGVEAFAQEIRMVELVGGIKGVVRTHEVFVWDGRLWIVMELMDRSLGEIVAGSGRLSDCGTARLGVALAKALRRVHRVGVVHCDVKPGNVLFDRRARAKLADFGFAAAVGSPGMHADGTVDLSLEFAAPERVEGAPPLPAADVYALGATLYYAAEGRPPFVRASPWSLVSAALFAEPDHFRAPHSLTLQRTIAAMLAKDAVDRPDLGGVIAGLHAISGR
jgi:serine/threonine protein kinase